MKQSAPPKSGGGGMTAEAFAWAELAAYREIRRHNFSKLQRLELELIVSRSFGRQRARAYLPKLQYFVDFTGVTRGNVSDTLNWLQLKLVIEEKRGYYGLNVNFLEWGVPLRTKSAAVEEQLELVLEPPDLRELMREWFVESKDGRIGEVLPVRDSAACGIFCLERMRWPLDVAASANGAIEPAGSRPVETTGRAGSVNLGPPSSRGDCLPASDAGKDQSRDGVPDSGTGGGGRGVPESGTIAKSASVCAGVALGVPESGTPFQNLERLANGSPPCTPLPKRLTVERSTLNAPKVTMRREAELMERLTAWLGSEEMVQYGGSWRVRWIRNCPDEVESEMRWGQDLERERNPDKPRNRAAWLNDRLCRVNGVRNVLQMKRGPPPA